MRKVLVLSFFFLTNFSILVATVSLLLLASSKKSSASEHPPLGQSNLISESYDSYSALPQTITPTEVTIIAGDARAAIIDGFFKRYESPMIGLGQDIISSSDKYNLPFGLLPAIAQCEGNLGKAIPDDSFNSWGYGIYSDTITRFKSWQQAIDAVSKGLRKDYFNYNLTTPEQIMKKYTPNSNGSWADCVDQFLAELH